MWLFLLNKQLFKMNTQENTAMNTKRFSVILLFKSKLIVQHWLVTQNNVILYVIYTMHFQRCIFIMLMSYNSFETGN